MVLCAVSADHSVIRLLEAPASATAGDRVTFPPFPADSVAATPAQMVKKKILEGLAPGVRYIRGVAVHVHGLCLFLHIVRELGQSLPRRVMSKTLLCFWFDSNSDFHFFLSFFYSFAPIPPVLLTGTTLLSQSVCAILPYSLLGIFSYSLYFHLYRR